MDAFFTITKSSDVDSLRKLIKPDNLRLIPLCKVLPRWKKGQEVKVIARLGPNENHHASDGVVRNVLADGKYQVRYDVWHVLKGNNKNAIEKDLPESLLTERDIPADNSRTRTRSHLLEGSL